MYTGHGEELAFLFHTAPLGGYNYTAEEEQLSDHMITYWTNLAKYGDPNGAGDLTWPQYTYQTKSVLRFMTPANKVCQLVVDNDGQMNRNTKIVNPITVSLPISIPCYPSQQ